MIRAFIAITPPEQITVKVKKLTKQLAEKFPMVRWEEPEKVHLTLAFLGAIPEQRIEKLTNVLKEATKLTSGFELSITHLSYFYKKHADSVIYLDIKDEGGTLRTLYNMLKRELNNQRFFLPERLAPHMTIGRLKRMRYPYEIKSILSEINQAKVKPMGEFMVFSIDLYESLYSKNINTTQYRLLRSFPLE